MDVASVNWCDMPQNRGGDQEFYWVLLGCFVVRCGRHWYELRVSTLTKEKGKKRRRLGAMFDLPNTERGRIADRKLTEYVSLNHGSSRSH